MFGADKPLLSLINLVKVNNVVLSLFFTGDNDCGNKDCGMTDPSRARLPPRKQKHSH
jgi:hypothetical protein